MGKSQIVEELVGGDSDIMVHKTESQLLNDFARALRHNGKHDLYRILVSSPNIFENLCAIADKVGFEHPVEGQRRVDYINNIWQKILEYES